MELSGTISDGAVKLNEPCAVPDGTKVTVRVEVARFGLGKRLLKHAGTVPDLPEDLAEQHDQYLHGAPRRNLLSVIHRPL